MAKRGRAEPATPRETAAGPKRRRGGEPPKTSGNVSSIHGRRIRYEEVPFEAGSTAHSRFVSGVVQANALHPDFQQAARSGDRRLAYAALMIGKESIAFNDRTGTVGDFLEKLLDFYFKLRARESKTSKKSKKSRQDKGRAPGDEQEPLQLAEPRQEDYLRP